MARFLDVFSDETKNGRKIQASDYLPNGRYPIIDQGQHQIAGYTDIEDGVFCDVPAIIFGDHTRAIKYIETPFFLGADGVKVLKSKLDDISYKYLFYCLENVKIPDTGYNRHFKWLKEAEFPLPSLEEQQKIAAVLDKVSDLIAKRRQQLEKLDLLVKARFVEMFGDPVSNPKQWETKGLAELGECKNGMNFHTEDSGIDIHCLGVGDFKDLSYITDTSMLPMISLDKMPSNEYLLQNGDIVFVRSNGNKDLVGRSIAVFPDQVPTTFSGFCIRFRLKSSVVQTDYLLRALKTDSVRKKMAGRGANIQNLNQKILSDLQMPIPPLNLQNQFSTFVEQIEKTKISIKKSLENMETLKKALMQKYFG